MTIRLGILTTHPIQYQVPWFRALSAVGGIDLTVFFCMMPNAEQQGEDFGVAFHWDVPLTSGFRWRLLRNVARAPSVSSFNGCNTPEISTIVREEKFDVFIVNGWVARSCVQLLRACNRYRVPCVVRGESNNLRPRAWWKRQIHRALLRRYAAFLFIGEANRRFYVENGVLEEKLFFAPYCVENERFATAASEFRARRDELRRDLAIASDALVLLFCGKFIAKKRPMDCLEALRRALGKGEGTGRSRPIHLLMAGSGELLAECKEFAARYGLPVTFTGFLNQTEMPRAYAASDCLILASEDGETWGLVVNEAMASGVPAIVSDRVGCHADLITPGITGQVFALGDVDGLAELISQVSRDPARLEKWSGAARERISHYTYHAVVEGTLAAIHAVSRGGEGRA